MAETSSGFDELAALVERLAVLLAAGVAPTAAWGYLAETADESLTPLIVEAADALAEGHAIPVASPSKPGRADADAAWRGLAAAWQIATEAGAPLASTLQRFATSLRDLADNQRDALTALAGPVATTRMVMVLPLVGVLFGLALGFDTLTTLFTTLPGLVCLVAGIALILVARRWNSRLVRGARPASVVPGLGLDLVAIAVSGGSSIPRALRSVDEARDRCGLAADDGEASLEQALSLSTRAGVPAASLLRSAADEARRTARSTGQRAAATLSVTLMLPLGLCILPAFMLLGVAPLLISVISSTVGEF